jgi:hypothetical protein
VHGILKGYRTKPKKDQSHQEDEGTHNLKGGAEIGWEIDLIE